jgi:hypothetical protein
MGEEEQLVLERILSLPRVRHPQHGHAFYPMLFSTPQSCIICKKRVLLFGTPCRCLLCGVLVHRQCYSRAVHAKTLPLCESSPEELHDHRSAATTAEADDGACSIVGADEGPSEVQQNDAEISIADSAYRARQLKRASLLAGATIVGGALGGPAGAMLGANGAAKAGCAVAGATLGYRRVRRQQMDYQSIAPTMEGVPDIWAERADEVRKRASLWTTPLSYSSSDQEVQMQLEGCNLEERVNVFIAKLLFDVRTIPGALCDALVAEYGKRHGNKDKEGEGFAEDAQRDKERELECRQLLEGAAQREDGRPPEHSEAVAVLSRPSPILDALGLIHEILLSVFQYHIKLAESEETIVVTINAVDRLVIAPLYDRIMQFLVDEHRAADAGFASKLMSVNFSSSDERVDHDALRALASAISARTAYEKLLCFTRFVERVSSNCDRRKGSSADNLLPALCLHFVASDIYSIHAELAFIDHFSRNDFMLLGREGYALTSVQAAVTALDNSSSEVEIQAICDDV